MWLLRWGLVVYEMVALRIPWDSEDFDVLIQDKVLAGETPRLPEAVLPEAVRAAVSSCWALDPQQRPDLRQLIATLKREVETIG